MFIDEIVAVLSLDTNFAASASACLVVHPEGHPASRM